MTSNGEACVCDPCDCDLPPISGGDSCVCPNPPCVCGLPKDECVCDPCECDPPTDLCVCDPCECETPQGSPKDPPATPQEEEEDFCGPRNMDRAFTLNEFTRAKEYFLTTSTNSGLNLYDHLAEVLRKMLDGRAPPNAVDFLEEVSLNVKRNRFGMSKDLIKDTFYLSPSVIEDAMSVLDTWKKYSQWSRYTSEEEENNSYGGFPNLMRLLYYLEQINVGLPREEMFRIALALRQLNMTHPIKRSRFWGKVFGIEKNYYVIEAELNEFNEEDLWRLTEEESQLLGTNEDEFPYSNFINAADTYSRARSAVTDAEILIPYQETSGLPPGPVNCILPQTVPRLNEYFGEGEVEGEGFEEAPLPLDPEAEKEAALWTSYQRELMDGFPIPPIIPEKVVVPPEASGEGVNRRGFYVTNELSEKWVLLPDISPRQIEVSRGIRRFLTGKLNTKLDGYPEFDGREAHYLKTLLARVTAGSQVSPKGYYKRKAPIDDEEEEEEEVEEEEEEEDSISDAVYAVKKFRPIGLEDLLSQPPELWVHHTSHILKQGRNIWWNPRPRDDEEELGEEEEEENEEAEREFGPRLFASLVNDVSFEGFSPWSPRPSSTVFKEFQIASIRSNLWPGASAFCTYKGKVENIYLGDGMKFRGICYAPPLPGETLREYIAGPELKEVTDPTYAQEQEWLNKLELEGIHDVEETFVDNAEEEDVDEEEEVTDDDD